MDKIEAHKIAMKISLKELEKLILEWDLLKKQNEILKESINCITFKDLEVLYVSLEKINIKYRKFAEENKYQKGVYRKWLTSHREDVNIAKKFIAQIQRIQMGSDKFLLCYDCKKRIWNGILHHCDYNNWDHLYNIEGCKILCKECNDKRETHQGLEG